VSLQRIVIDTELSADGFKSVCDLAPGQLVAVQNFENYIAAIAGGNQSAILSFQVGAVQAAGTLTFASTGPTNTQTCSILNVTFTAVTSGATGNQFNISATPATVAANLAAAINASANLTGKVTATSELGVVTITCVVPGAVGNGLALSAGTLSNTTAGAFAGGSDGTSYVIDLM
jgi:phage tail sheath gpL-like